MALTKDQKREWKRYILKKVMFPFSGGGVIDKVIDHQEFMATKDDAEVIAILEKEKADEIAKLEAEKAEIDAKLAELG